MNTSALFCIITAVLITQIECRYHYRNMIVRRQYPQSFQGAQLQDSNQFQSGPPQFDEYPAGNTGESGFYPGDIPGNDAAAHQNILWQRNAELPPEDSYYQLENNAMPPENSNSYRRNAEVPPLYSYSQPGSATIPPENSNSQPGINNFVPPPEPEISLDTSSTNEMITPAPPESYVTGYLEPSSSMSSFQPNSYVSLRRKRQDAPKEKDELVEFLEKGKKLLEVPAVNKDKSGTVKLLNESAETDVIDSNATLIPIDKGVQLKSMSKYADGKILSEVNISSSTLTTLLSDNNTEVENVVAMHMQKKLEDDKGIDRGFEDVRIIETERVKPLFSEVRKSSATRRRKRKSYSKRHKKRFTMHHRSKRSKIESEEAPSSKLVYNKMARRFLSVVRRKERVVDPSNASYWHVIPRFQETNHVDLIESTTRMEPLSVIDKQEIEDFMKFFLKQMKEFRKSKRHRKNTVDNFKTSCVGRWCNSFGILPHNTTNMKTHLYNPDHGNIIMNFSMTWDSKMKRGIVQSLKIFQNQRNSRERVENATGTPTELRPATTIFTTKSSTLAAVPVFEKQDARRDTRFLTVLLLVSGIMFLFSLTAMIVPRLYRIARMHRENSAIKTYNFYQKCPTEEPKGLCENPYSEDCPDLEWQSENGDWLSVKDYEFK